MLERFFKRTSSGAALLALLASWPTVGHAQRLAQVAVVMNTAPVASLLASPPTAPAARAFHDGMKDLGWVEGRTVKFIWRSAEQHPERFPQIMDELVRMKVDVIVVSGNRAARDAVEKSRTIPIVLGASEFAAEDGLVESYARPGGNVTGMSSLVHHLDAKRFFLLKELAPNIKRVVILGQLSKGREISGRQTRAAMEALGITGWNVRADRGEDIEPAFNQAVREGADAIILSSTGPMHQPENQALINALAIKHRIPVLHAVLAAAQRGGLIAFAPDELAGFRRAASHVDRLLRGADPAQMPIEHPNTVHLHVNRRAAASIGLRIPESILIQADRVFD